MQKLTKYFSKHPGYNTAVTLLTGIGIGILLTYPFAGSHPVRWGSALVALGVVGYFYAWSAKK